jgi:hypothetical protein
MHGHSPTGASRNHIISTFFLPVTAAIKRRESAMLYITIKDGRLLRNGQVIDLSSCSLNKKVAEVFQYLLKNNISLVFEKRDDNISFSALRPDIKNRLINALRSERLIRR